MQNGGGEIMSDNFVLKLLYRIKRRIFLKSSGHILSSHKGEGFDFAELIPYSEGMDARRIYWNSLAKGGEIQRKTFYEDKEIHVCVGVILGGSLLFGMDVKKYEKLLEVVSVLGYSTIHSKNQFQGIFWSEKEYFGTPSSKNVYSVEHFVKKISKKDLLYQKIDSDKCVKTLDKLLLKKSLLFLAGDFLQMYDLKKLSVKHEIIVVIIRDRFEEEATYLGEKLFVDPESGEELEIFFDKKTAQAYTKRYKDHDKKLEKSLTKLGIRFVKIYTDEDPFLKLGKL